MPGGGFSSDPVDRLHGSSFSSYLGACRAAGLKYNERVRKQTAPEVEGFLERFLAELERVGLNAIVDEAVRAPIEGAIREGLAREEFGAQLAKAAEEKAARNGKQLFPFQVEGVRWLGARDCGLLGDEMGLGKTVQAICALDELPAVVVVVPANVKVNWENEIRSWRPDLRTERLSGRDSFRWPRPGEVVITNYDILPPVKAEVRISKKATPDERAKLQAKRDAIPELPPTRAKTHIIADEAHLLKNSGALRTVRFRELKRHVLGGGGRAWLLTGTPLLNRPDELWNVLAAADLETEAFGSWWNFLRLFQGRKGRHGLEWGTPSPEVPALLRRVALVRKRRDVMPDLPTKTRTDITVDLDDRTRTLCNEALQVLRDKGIDLEDVNAVIDETKIAGAAFEKVSKARAALAAAKTSAAIEVVEEFEEQGVPLVVFSFHRMAADVIGKRPGWRAITGDVSSEDRAAIVAELQAGRLKGVVGTIQAMGVGLTMTAAHNMLFVDLSWTPALNSQAEDRCLRIGQKNAVLIRRLVADHAIDYRVLHLITIKQLIIEGSVDAAAVKLGAANDEAAKANAERLEKITAMAGVFSAAAIVDGSEIERERARREEAIRAAEASVQVETVGGRKANEKELAAIAIARTGQDPRTAAALAHYADRAQLGMTDLEWAALERMMELHT